MAGKPKLLVEKLLIVGGIAGGLFGAWLGVSSGYAIAEFVGVSHRETQAYFMMFVSLPICGLIGIGSGAAAATAIAAKRKVLLAVVAAIGWAALLFALVLGIRWRMPTQPAEFRVRNDTDAALEQTRLGADYRRARSIGSVAPGATSDYVEVDLDKRGTFNAVRGTRRDRHFSLTLELEQQTSLTPGRYTCVLREGESEGKLELALEPEQ